MQNNSDEKLWKDLKWDQMERIVGFIRKVKKETSKMMVDFLSLSAGSVDGMSDITQNSKGWSKGEKDSRFSLEQVSSEVPTQLKWTNRAGCNKSEHQWSGQDKIYTFGNH